MTHYLDVIFDITKVNVVAWGTIGLTQSGIIHMADITTAVGTAVLVLVSVIYTVVKLTHLLNEWQWAKEDRRKKDEN